MTPTADSVADALMRLAGDPVLRRRLGEEGRRRVSRHTWEASVDDVVDVYRTLAGPPDGVPKVAALALDGGGTA